VLEWQNFLARLELLGIVVEDKHISLPHEPAGPESREIR